MDQVTAINDKDVTISNRDKTVNGLWFYKNKKLFFLPVKVGKIFPNLQYYTAHSCAIKEVKKENFQGLVKLQNLWLSDNQIEKVPSDTFESLRKLTHLDLGEKFNFFTVCDKFFFLKAPTKLSSSMESYSNYWRN